MTAGSTGKWTFTPTGLADGAHSLIASETDAAGKTGSAQVSLTLDTAVPVVTAARTWDTLLNFHAGDMLTLWGYNAASGNVSWSDAMGAAGYQGATLHAGFGDGSGASALVTFEGLTTNGAHLLTSTGISGGVSYLAVTRTS